MEFWRSLFPSKSIIPRWVVLFIDTFICSFSFIFAIFLRYNFHVYEQVYLHILSFLPLILGLRILSMLYFRSYAGIIRYTSLQDAIRVLYTLTASSFLIGVIAVYPRFQVDGQTLIPISIVIIDYFAALFLMSAFRFATKILYMEITKPSASNLVPVAIFGAGESGMITKKKLEQQRGNEVKVVAFFDDDPNKFRTYIDGVSIFNEVTDFEKVVQKFQVKDLIISVQNISKNRKHEIIERCLALNIQVRHTPPVERWINGELSYKQIKNIRIEDVIDRDTIELDRVAVAHQIKGKSILVTGAAGSIGSEIVKQLIAYNPRKLILLDKSEIGLYQLDNFLSENHQLAYSTSIEILVGDICDENRMHKLFKTYKPNIVYHAEIGRAHV